MTAEELCVSVKTEADDAATSAERPEQQSARSTGGPIARVQGHVADMMNAVGCGAQLENLNRLLADGAEASEFQAIVSGQQQIGLVTEDGSQGASAVGAAGAAGQAGRDASSDPASEEWPALASASSLPRPKSTCWADIVDRHTERADGKECGELRDVATPGGGCRDKLAPSKADIRRARQAFDSFKYDYGWACRVIPDRRAFKRESEQHSVLEARVWLAVLEFGLMLQRGGYDYQRLEAFDEAFQVAFRSAEAGKHKKAKDTLARLRSVMKCGSLDVSAPATLAMQLVVEQHVAEAPFLDWVHLRKE